MRRIAITMATVAFSLLAVTPAGAAEPTHEYFTTSDNVKIHYMQAGREGSYAILIQTGFATVWPRRWPRRTAWWRSIAAITEGATSLSRTDLAGRRM